MKHKETPIVCMKTGIPANLKMPGVHDLSSLTQGCL